MVQQSLGVDVSWMVQQTAVTTCGCQLDDSVDCSH